MPTKHLPTTSLWSKSKIDEKDLILITLLLLVVAPFYLLFLYTVPFQVNTDEIAIMLVIKQAISQNIDVLGPSSYFDFPWLIFYFFGKAGSLLGGINLYNMRLIHAVSGVAIVASSYLFFRSFWGYFYSLLAALILGFNHSLMTISRMAMRDNTGLLFEVMSLAFLLHGLRKKSKLLSFIGGVFGGLSFYAYHPGRLTYFLWIAFIGSAFCFFRNKVNLKNYRSVILSSLLAFILTILPITVKTNSSSQEYTGYAKEQITLFKEGRELQQSWSGADTSTSAVKANILSGLGMFNSQVSDRGYVYPNDGHGFVDPVSGMLIWVGLSIIFVSWVRGKRKPGDLFGAEGFLIIWLLFTFFLTKNPNYTRLLIILPFTTYLVVTAIRKISHRFAWPSDIALLVTLAIVSSNLIIFSDFALEGLSTGNDVGGTARIVESKKNIPEYNFYLVSDEQYPYYSWGDKSQWQSWISFFTTENQRTTIVSPEEFSIESVEIPATIFLNKSLWNMYQASLNSEYSNPLVTELKLDGSLLAVEILE